MSREVVLFSSLLHLFLFFILVFHLQQKHEEGQRLLQYLQHTNNALVTCIRNQDILKLKLNAYKLEFSVKSSNAYRNVCGPSRSVFA